MKTFETNADVQKYIDDKGKDYGKKDSNGLKDQMCFGIIFSESSSQKWTYDFHMNMTGRPEYRDLFGFARSEKRLTKFRYEADKNLKRNFRGGVYYLINYIDTEILRHETSNAAAEINVKMVKMPVPAYKTSEIYENIGANFHNLIIFPNLVIFLRFAYNILFEKENRITQNLTNMGMSMFKYYASWHVFYSIIVFIYSVFWTIVTKRSLGPDVNVLLYFLLFFLTSQYFLTLAILVSSLFSRAKPGILSAIICFLFLFGIATANSSIDPDEVSTNGIFAISPIAGLRLACRAILLVQSFYQSFGFSLFSEAILGFKYSIWFWITLIKSVFFYWLAIYLDQIWPKETGVAKNACFCFTRKAQRKLASNAVSPANNTAVLFTHSSSV